MSIWLLPVLFSLVAIVTRKDLAMYVAIVSVLSYMVGIQSDWYREHTLIVYAALNTSLAVFASYHFAAYRHKLAAVTTILSFLAVINNLIQVVEFTQFSVKVSTGLGWMLLACLVTMNGRRGWIQDAMDSVSYNRDRVHSDSYNRNDDGDS